MCEKNSGSSFLGIRSGNFSNDCTTDDMCQKRCSAELVSQPYISTISHIFCNCGVHKLPFFIVFRDMYIEWFLGSKDFKLSFKDSNGDSSINLKTLLPSNPSNEFIIFAEGQPQPFFRKPLNDFVFNVLNEFVIPKDADSGIVIDVTDVTTIANSINNNLSHKSSFDFASNVQGKLHQVARFSVYNNSSNTVYLLDETPYVTFENVVNKLGVRPKTKVTVEYHYQQKRWIVIDTNSRA